MSWAAVPALHGLCSAWRIAAESRVAVPALPGLLAKPMPPAGKLEVFCYDFLPSFSIYSWHDWGIRE